MDRLTPDDPRNWHRFQLAAFCRLIWRYRRLGREARLSIDAVAREVAEGRLHGEARDAAMDELADWLYGDQE